VIPKAREAAAGRGGLQVPPIFPIKDAIVRLVGAILLERCTRLRGDD